MSGGDLFDLIVRCTRDILPDLGSHSFQPTDNFEMLGANSMDRADIVTLVLEELDLEVPLTSMAGCKNIGELAVLLNEKMRK